ncbi:MAG: SMP-30/gluconolactonase/LRE family protein [Tannerella sp.]|jgi:gluconolactonase|nr:SMP-30/gluconolactonase/LRE family protein [Tannerella sp.]
MAKNLFLTLAIMLAATSAVAQTNEAITASGEQVVLLSDGFSFTEGPAVDHDGNIYFTDQPNDKILRWSVDEKKMTVFSDNTGRANGLYFDLDGKLLACSDLENEIWRFDMMGGHEVVLTDFDGKKLNGPNDLWVHPSGGIYFTDPLYKRDYWKRDPEMQQDGQHVYYLAPGSTKAIRVDNSLQQPNGIIGTSDGRLLYVADIRAGKTYTFDIQADGTLTNKRLFCEMGSDGMTIDSKGNIYLTGRGVTVFNPKGEKIVNIPVDAQWTANVCFGGKDMKTLFITASNGFYAIRTRVAGVRNSEK